MQSIAVDLSRETQERIGQIFGILSTDADPRAGDALIATVEDALVRGINEGLLSHDAAADKIFEGAVSRVNAALAKVIEDRNLPVDPATTRSVLVLQKGADVVISTWGEPHVLLFHVSDRRPSGRVYDLLSDSRNDQGSGEPSRRRSSRSYSNIISGIVGERDRLLLATHDLSQWLPQEELKRLVLSGTPDSASVALQGALMQAAPKLAVALLLVDAEHEDAVAPAGPYMHPSAPQHSMDNLLHTADRTNTIMSPPVVGSLLRRLRTSAVEGLRQAKDALMAGEKEPLDASMEELRDAAATEEAEVTDVSSSILEEFIVSAPQNFSEEGPTTPSPGTSVTTDVPLPATPAMMPSHPAPGPAVPAAALGDRALRMGKNALQALVRRTDSAAADIIHNFNSLPRKRRLLLLSSLALVLVLNHSVALTDWTRHSQATAATTSKKIATIEQKIDSAESSIIYRDEERARALLGEASVLVAELPGRPDAAGEERDRLNGLIAGKFNALRHAVALPAAQVVASITGTAGAVDLVRLVLRQQIAWSGAADGAVFRTDLKTGTTTEAGKGAAAPTVFVPASNGLISGTGARLTRYNYASDGSTEVPIDLGGNEVTVTDAEPYGTRLYVLDAPHNRILRHDVGTAGYGAPTFYLKDGTDLSSGVSIAIDGAVYIALRDGSVVRLLSGTREDFTVQKVDPAVTAPLKIRTLDDSDKIYLLEGSRPARIIVFSKKTGSLLAQYVSEELNGARDFAVDEASKTLYAVQGNRVLKFAIPEAR